MLYSLSRLKISNVASNNCVARTLKNYGEINGNDRTGEISRVEYRCIDEPCSNEILPEYGPEFALPMSHDEETPNDLVCAENPSSLLREMELHETTTMAVSTEGDTQSIEETPNFAYNPRVNQRLADSPADIAANRFGRKGRWDSLFTHDRSELDACTQGRWRGSAPPNHFRISPVGRITPRLHFMCCIYGPVIR